MKAAGILVVVSKLRWLGGSKGKSGYEVPQSLFPLSPTAQMFQNVHRDTDGAPGMLPVSTWRK